MSAVLTLYNYPEAGTNDAALISVPIEYQGLVQVFDTTTVDVTDYLILNSILLYRRIDHGWIVATDAQTAHNVATDAATAWKVTETYYPMSIDFNAGETPIFFARIVNSLTQTPLKTSDVSSVSLTIYQYSANNIRSSVGTGYVPLNNWEDVALTVADVIDDTPSEDPRVRFMPNLIYEPNTLTDNPFETPGQYRAAFTITPAEGNRIPAIIDFRVR